MTETQFLLAMLDEVRGRTLGTLAAVAALPDPTAALKWRPAPGRANIGWQIQHVAATDDRYLHMRLLDKPVADEALSRDFGGGSTPADTSPSVDQIKAALERHRAVLKSVVAGLAPSELDVKPFSGAPRTWREAIMLLIWHEAHHQGQAHLTLNMFKAAHGLAK